MHSSNGTMQQVAYNCKGCDRPDHIENMVACDRCNTWWHFSCAGVTGSVANRSWSCNNCSTFCGSITSIRSTSAQLRLKQLEEKKALEDQQAQKDREFLAQKHQLEIEAEAEKEGGSLRSFRSRRSQVDVHHWVNEQNPEHGKATQPVASTSTPIASSVAAGIAPRPLFPGGQYSLGYTAPVSQPIYTVGTIPIRPQMVPSAAQQHQIIQESGSLQLNQAHMPPMPQVRNQPFQLSTSFGLSKPMLPPMIPMVTTLPSLPDVKDTIDPPIMMPNQRQYIPVTLQQSAACLPPSYLMWPSHAVIAPPSGSVPKGVSFPSNAQSDGAQRHFISSIPELAPEHMHRRQPPVMPNNQYHPTEMNIRPNPSFIVQQPIPPSNPSEYCPVPQQSAPAHIPPSHTVWPTDGLISPQQLAARYVVSKELPKFSGDPLEWPMFLSSFESTTAMCGIQPDENLARLQKSLIGSAREKVQSILTLPSAIPEIIDTLRDECGRPEQLLHCLLSRIRSAPSPNVNKLETLVTFGREVRNLVTYIEASNLQAHLSNPMLLMELVGKLPPSMRLEWGLHCQRISDASLRAFSDYASSIKIAACQVSLPTDYGHADGSSRRSLKKEKDGFVNTHSTDNEHGSEPGEKLTATYSNQNRERRPCLACQCTDHRIRNCDKFFKFTLLERLKFVEQNELCRRCLSGHGKWPCRTKQPCGVHGCTEPHHKLLHSETSKADEENIQQAPAVLSAHCHNLPSSLFKIIPVILHNNERSVSTFAFLDDGSDLTLLENGLADELGLEGVESSLCLQWTSNVSRKESSSKRVQLTISGVDRQSKYTLQNVRTVDNLCLPKQNLDYQELSKRFAFLRGLPIQSYFEAAPRILIGVDNARLKLPLNKRDRRDEEPVAIKTRLGWTVFGGRHETAGHDRVMIHVCNCSDDRKLHDLVKDYFALEDLGVTTLAVPESTEDQRARKILQETTRRTESGRFETGLLWKTDKVVFPNSYPMAVRRLKCLERRLRLDSNLQKAVTDQIAEYEELGYAHKATTEELGNTDHQRVWYLPLGVVCNPRKPNKIRVVWDAAATVNGISLNSKLLKGPDLLTPLLSVLCRFRQRQYAIAGDIRQMFHQLQIREEDRHSQRFLWRSDEHSTPEIYIMDVATFGASCSPCSAQYVKNTNARDFSERYPEAATAIINNTYVDDYLDSRDTIEEAAKLAVDVRTVHSKAGFEIRNWQSNSDQVLRRVGVETTNAVKSFSAEKTTVAERVLGIMWIPDEDVFVFAAQFRSDLQPLLTGEIIPTKRQILQVVMSLFDPLGLIATYTIHGKIIIQDVWRSGIKWDEPIKENDFTNWQRWVKLAPELDRVRIPRCYFPNYGQQSYQSLQLHVFVDASELAYCCVAYFRIIDGNTPRCILVASKAKVTPLQPQTIPRNELNAAVLGIRLMKTITENHNLPIQQRFLWTDSTTVLSWLKADPRKYRQYVAFRIAEILAETTIEEWNWVPTKMNIADHATKWGSGPSFDAQNIWFRGPDFLYLPETNWPSRKLDLNEATEELRNLHVHRRTSNRELVEFSKFSRFEDLLKRLAYLHHFARKCRSHDRALPVSRSVSLTQHDYIVAEKSLWRMVQAEAFETEIAVLKQNADLPIAQRLRLGKTSPLKGLSPFLDEDGIIRMESRIDPKAAYYCFNFRNPVILPRQSHVTELLILRFHQRYGHANKSTVMNEMQQKFHVPKLRSVVNKIVKKCMWCRVYRAKPIEPRMAPLPQVRVTPYVRPFTFVGLDYFGPLLVKRGRSNHKRWVALFTCLTVRAIHVEVVHSLSAESCKMAIRRFIARRGTPQQIFSDNGTNFRGAARELSEEIKTINRSIAAAFTNAETEWHFNPPSAPHMGGAWERKVRSVKEALKVLSHRDKLDDEGLTTLLSEAEMIVNSHPLTFVPLETPEQEVVTPNNFLLMSSGGASNTNRSPAHESICLRTNWKLLQHLLNQFWKRWVQAYLPTIARRTKWFSEQKSLQEGDLVIVVDETVRNGWLRGRIIKTYPGLDGQVRKVDVLTNNGTLQRPVIKVALLDVLNDSKANHG
ncbi:uncharacterized protein LOC131679471 [Topomyia yanbarensis]|uniref:uncharacterized protein LOC131679471 n=1 Tax=Topomyia yanbarensis TaxID=2498891 RepID=UPI00273B3A0F|nr:uncharacterized protein LOC131679471 [Topomyia yanbarensis]